MTEKISKIFYIERAHCGNHGILLPRFLTQKFRQINFLPKKFTLHWFDEKNFAWQRISCFSTLCDERTQCGKMKKNHSRFCKDFSSNHFIVREIVGFTEFLVKSRNDTWNCEKNRHFFTKNSWNQRYLIVNHKVMCFHEILLQEFFHMTHADFFRWIFFMSEFFCTSIVTSRWTFANWRKNSMFWSSQTYLWWVGIRELFANQEIRNGGKT